MNVIDTHAHVYPAAYLDHLESIGIPSASTRIARDMQADITDDDMSARLAMMDTAGVSTQVLSVTPQLPMVDDRDAAVAACRLVNDEYARIVDRYPGRFLVYGAAPLPHMNEAAAEVGNCLDERGFAGMAMTTIVRNDMYPSDPALDPFFTELNARDAILYIHPTGCGASSPMITSKNLEWVTGAPIEDALAVLHLLKANVPERFPRIKFHIAHLGGDLAFFAQRIEDNFEDWGAFGSSPAESLKKMWFDAANFYPPALRLAMETFDPKRVMCGSDYPYFRHEKYTRAVEYIERAGLARARVDDILVNNAAELYGRGSE